MGRLSSAVVSMLVVAAVVAAPPLARPALAADGSVLSEINEIKHRLSTLEGKKGEDKGPWFDRVTLSGLIEVEAGIVDHDNGSESDIAVATVELGVDAQVSDYSSGHLHLLYEDDPGTLDVDEATVTIGNSEKFPFYFTAGKMYVPFGFYETHMISDPWTLDLGETNEGAGLIGMEAGGFRLAYYVFNGDTSDGGDDRVDHDGASVGFGLERENFRLDVGADWISSIRDSNGLFDATTTGGAPHEQAVGDYTEGAAAHVVIGLGPLTLIGEYVTALDDVNGAGTNSELNAFNVEAGVTFPLGSVETVIAVGYQETDEAEWALPEKRALVSLAMEILPDTVLALEWMNEEEYDANGGMDWDVYTMKLAVVF